MENRSKMVPHLSLCGMSGFSCLSRATSVCMNLLNSVSFFRPPVLPFPARARPARQLLRDTQREEVRTLRLEGRLLRRVRRALLTGGDDHHALPARVPAPQRRPLSSGGSGSSDLLDGLSDFTRAPDGRGWVVVGGREVGDASAAAKGLLYDEEDRARTRTAVLVP